MATRLYIRENTAAVVDAPADVGWTGGLGVGFARRQMATTVDPTDTLIDIGIFQGGETTYTCFRQWLSPPMPAGVVFTTGVATFTAVAMGFEWGASYQTFFAYHLRIVSQDGQTTRLNISTFGSPQQSGGGELDAGQMMSRDIFSGRPIGGTTYTTLLGDRFVVDIGSYHGAGAGSLPEFSMRAGSAGTGDCLTGGTSTSSTLRPWFESSTNIAFLAEGGGAEPITPIIPQGRGAVTR